MNSGCQEAIGLEPKGSTLNYYDQTFPLELSNPDYLVVYVVEEMPRSWVSSCSEGWTCSGSLLKTLGPYPYKANSITDLLNKARLRAGCDACKCSGSHELFSFNSLKYDYWNSGLVELRPNTMGPGIPPVGYIKSSLGLELLCDCPCGEWVYDLSVRQTIPNKSCMSSYSQGYCNKDYIGRICDQRNLKISIYYKKIDQIQPENDTVYDYDNYQKNYSLIESLPRVVNINSTINLKDFIKPSNLPCATTGGCFNTGPCNYGGGCGPGRINLTPISPGTKDPISFTNILDEVLLKSCPQDVKACKDAFGNIIQILYRDEKIGCQFPECPALNDGGNTHSGGGGGPPSTPLPPGPPPEPPPPSVCTGPGSDNFAKKIIPNGRENTKSMLTTKDPTGSNEYVGFRVGEDKYETKEEWWGRIAGEMGIKTSGFGIVDCSAGCPPNLSETIRNKLLEESTKVTKIYVTEKVPGAEQDCSSGKGVGIQALNLITTGNLSSYLDIQATKTEAQTVPQAFLEMSNIKWTVVDGANLVSEREGDLQKNPSLTFINKGTVKIKFIEKGRTLKPKIIAPELIKNGPQGYYLIDSPEKVFANVPIEANLVKIVEIKIASEEQKIVGLSTAQSDYVFGREYVLPKYGQIFSDDGTIRQGKLIQYTSSNINVAKIQDGNKLIFFGKGKTVITAALEGDLNLQPYSVSFEIQSKLPNIIVCHYPLIGTNNTIEVNISNFSGLGHFVPLPISTSSALPVTIKIGQGGSFYEEEGFTADPRYFNSSFSSPIKWGYNSLTNQYGLFIKTTGQYQVLITQQGDTVYDAAEPILLNIVAQGKTQTYSMTDFPEILTLARRHFYTDFNISLGNTTSGIILNSSNHFVAYPDSVLKGWELKEPGIVTLSIKVPGNDIYAPLEIFKTLEIKTAIPNLYLNFDNQKIILPEQADKIISLAPQIQAKKGISTVFEMTSDSSADFRLKVYTYNPNSGLKEEEINTNNIYIFDSKQIVVNSDQIGEYVISLEQFATDRWSSASTHFRLKIIENKIQEFLYNPISPKNLGDSFIFEIKSSSKKQINLTSLDSDCVNISRISGPDASGLVKFNINILQHKPLIKLEATVGGDSSWDQKTENIYFSIISSINNSSVKTLEVSGQIPSSDYFFNDLGLNTDPAGLYELKVDYYQGLQIPFYVQKSITFSDNDGGFALINAEHLKSNKNLKIFNKNLYHLDSNFINRNVIENIINNTKENSSNCCASASDQIFKINNQLSNYMLIRWRGSLKESLVSKELSYAVSESFINENNIIDPCIIYSNISLGSIINTCVPQNKYMAYQFAENLSLPEELRYCCKIFIPKDSRPCLLIKASQEEKEKVLNNCRIFIKNNSSTPIQNCEGQRIKYSNGLTPEKKNVVMLDSCLAPQEIRQISLDKFSALENECFNYQIETKCSSTGEYIGTESSAVCVNCLNINRNLAVLDEEVTNQEKDDNLLKIDDSILLSHGVYPVDKIKSIKINSIPKNLESFSADFEIGST